MTLPVGLETVTLPITKATTVPSFLAVTYELPIEGRHSERAGRKVITAPLSVAAIRLINGLDPTVPTNGAGKHREEVNDRTVKLPPLRWDVDARRPTIRARIATRLERIAARLFRKVATEPMTYTWPHDGHTLTEPEVVVRVCRDMDTDGELTLAWHYDGSEGAGKETHS